MLKQYKSSHISMDRDGRLGIYTLYQEQENVNMRFHTNLLPSALLYIGI